MDGNFLMGDGTIQQPMTPEVIEAIALGMPKCPVCAGQNVRLSHTVSLQDTLLGVLRYLPYRCRVCQHRFYKRLQKGAKPPKPFENGATG
jgi:hypothetical protein